MSKHSVVEYVVGQGKVDAKVIFAGLSAAKAQAKADKLNEEQSLVTDGEIKSYVVKAA